MIVPNVLTVCGSREWRAGTTRDRRPRTENQIDPVEQAADVRS